jgi:hypothetical protein
MHLIAPRARWVGAGSSLALALLLACHGSTVPKGGAGGSPDEEDDAGVSPPDQPRGGKGGAGGGAGQGGQGGSQDSGGAAGAEGGRGGGGGSEPPDADPPAGGRGGAGGMGGGTAPPPDPNCTPSKLYGRTGELWKPDGRLIDVGYAGYHTGLDPIPEVAGPMKSVTEFGAKGDDMVDDTAAFLAAIAGTDGVLLVPAGRYIITKQLDIKKSHFVLRGQGTDKTTLYFPRPLSEVGPAGTNWSFNGGFLTVSGTDEGPVIGTITANAAHGANKLMVSSTAGVKVGDWVRVVQTDKAGALFKALYGGMHAGNVAEDGNTEVFHFYSPVTAVDAGSVTLERTLPFQVDTGWTPQLRAVAPTAREVGIEGLTLEMAAVKYPGHFNEKGYNGIYYVGAHDSWVRNVKLLNAELGISIYRSYFVTVTDVVLDANTDRGGYNGHHGLNSARGADCWFTRFDVHQKYVHDLTVDGYAMGTVFSRGKGADMNMDHHGRAPYGTLWTTLDLGKGTRAFDNGGASNRLPPTASYTTVWNVGGGSLGLPPSSYGPNMNFVASVKGTPPASWSVESIAPASLCQPDLHEAMLAARRK